jgi:serine/threonine protein kinase
MRVCGRLDGIDVDWDAFMGMYRVQHDFIQEVHNLQRFASIFNRPGSPIRVPRVYASGTRYILMQLMGGSHPYHLVHMTTAERAHVSMLVGVAHMYANLFHGVVHGDPHEGNVLVSTDHRSIALIDFGLCIPTRPKAEEQSSELATHPTILLYSLARQPSDVRTKRFLRYLTGNAHLEPSSGAYASMRAFYKDFDTAPPHMMQKKLRDTLCSLGLAVDHMAIQFCAVHAMVCTQAYEHVPAGCDATGLLHTHVFPYMLRYAAFRQSRTQQMCSLLRAVK